MGQYLLNQNQFNKIMKKTVDIQQKNYQINTIKQIKNNTIKPSSTLINKESYSL